MNILIRKMCRFFVASIGTPFVFCIAFVEWLLEDEDHIVDGWWRWLTFRG